MVSGVSFRPGDSVGIVAPWFVAVVESERGGELGNALIELSESPAGGVDELVEVVAALPLRTLPDFALGVVELHVVRVLVRGAMAAHIDRYGRTEIVDGSDVRTWRELSIERPSEVRVGVADELDLAAYYWTAGGVVPVSTVVVSTASDGFAALRAVPTVMPPVAQAPFDPGMLGEDVLAPEPLGADVGEPEPIAAEPEPDLVTAADIEADIVPNVEPDIVDEDYAAAPRRPPAADEKVSEHSDQTLLPVEHWGGEPPAAERPATAVSVMPAEDDDPYAELWMTKVRAVEDAAVRSTAEGEPSVAPPLDATLGGNGAGVAGLVADHIAEGDHDGHTRTVASLGAAISAGTGAPDHDADVSSGGVPSSPCANGHPNPPFAVTCRRCLAPVKETVERVARADAGVLVLPDGERIEVDRTIVVGRSPKADGLFTGDPPRLVGLAEQHDVSRTHVVIELSGWTAMVTDQDSMNGTEVQLPGKPPEQLRPHAPMAIVVGTKIVLANEVTLKLEGG